MSDEHRDKLLRRMAAHQLRMGQMLVAMHMSKGGVVIDEAAAHLGEHNYYLERAICETSE